MRILILYCEEGEGHAAAARTLARELEAAGAEVATHDALAGGLGRLIPLVSRDAYHLQTRFLRWSYGLEYLLFARLPPTRAVGRRGLAAFGGRPLRRLVASYAPDLVVSTHPSVTNVLGFLRRRGRLAAPVVATITDFGVHPLWSHRGVDLHLVMHESGRPAVERIAGRGSAQVVRAIVEREFRAPAPRAAARRELGLPADGAVALVSGGGWGVGDLGAAVAAALEVPGLAVVCLAGRNEQLRRRLAERFAGEPRVRVAGFTDRMPAYIAAADVLVDTTLGVTCLEAMASGRPVVAYGVPPGHSRGNARALVRLGLATAPRTRPELVAELTRLTGTQSPVALANGAAVGAAEAILAARPRVQPRRTRPALVGGAATLAMLVFAGWTFASPRSYPVVASALELGVSSVPTGSPDVALVVETPRDAIPRLASTLQARGLHASFAVRAVPSAAERRSAVAAGDALVPELPHGGPAGVIRAPRDLRRLARGLELGHRFYFLVPRSGFTLGAYVAAKAAGGVPIAGARMDGSATLARLRPGSIVVVAADGGYARSSLAELAAALSSRRLRAVPLDELLPSGASARATGAERASTTAPAPTSASATTIPASRVALAGHHSRASSGASPTGTKVFSAKTSGATCATGRRCSEDISASVPSPEAIPIATNQTAKAGQAR